MRYAIAHPPELPPVECPCGQARRAFLEESGGVASLHVTDVSINARTHYHRQLTEIYYVLEGEGELELDGHRHAVRPGDAVLIKPGCRHRAIGRLRVLIAAIPAFNAADEWFD